MSFEVLAEAYARFMGRYAEPLAEQLVGLVDPDPGARALDVGCGPGVVTARLVERLGEQNVAAIDPSPPFVAEVRRRWPAVDTREGSAEQLPFDDEAFDVTVANLVVHFMTDPVAGLREMARVTRPAGRVAATVWNHAGGCGPLSLFWDTARELDPNAPGEADLPGTKDGQLVELATAAGLVDPSPVTLTVTVTHPTFEQWWDPYFLGVGPAGAYASSLGDAERERLRARLEEKLPPAPFEIRGDAWCVLARA